MGEITHIVKFSFYLEVTSLLIYIDVQKVSGAVTGSIPVNNLTVFEMYGSRSIVVSDHHHWPLSIASQCVKRERPTNSGVGGRWWW